MPDPVLAFFLIFFCGFPVWGFFIQICLQLRINDRNRASPLLNREAVIVGKLLTVSGAGETYTTKSYYLT
jgi:hypothetical protein